MIYLTKEEINYKLENIPFYKELEIEDVEKSFLFKINNTPRSIFPVDHKGLHRSIDQIIMTGHFLYGKNRKFREAYLQAMDNHEFNINYKSVEEARTFFTRNMFNLFLYGIVTYSYINSLSDSPMHYFARPIVDERNPSLEQFLKEEREINKHYKRTDGTPFYNYIMKKSFALNPSMNNFSTNIVCPIKRNIPEIKQISSNINELAVYVFKRMLSVGTDEDKKFIKSFIDESWSPYLKAN